MTGVLHLQHGHARRVSAIGNAVVEAPSSAALGRLIGVSRAMQSVHELVSVVAPTRAAVLITGETGTGKELVARAIHALSPRAAQAFVPLNCAAIPADLFESELFGHVRGAFTGAYVERRGKFDSAAGGTLFLDEVGDMAYPLQSKLLRVLEEGTVVRVGSDHAVHVDVRIVSSTNRDLGAALHADSFRRDLYFRLGVFHIHMPPLRERREDVPHIAAFFLERFGHELGKGPIALESDAAEHLSRHNWPGNVRELRNVVEQAAILCTNCKVDASVIRRLLPEREAAATDTAPTLQLAPAVAAFERSVILRALTAANDVKAEAARLLGVSERTLWYKLKRHGL